MILQTIANQPALWQKLLRAPRAGRHQFGMVADDLPPSIAMVMDGIMK